MTPLGGRSVSRSLILALTTLLMLGHACELPAFAGVFTPAGGHAHDSSDHHSADRDGDESQVSCDPPLGLPSSSGGGASVTTNLDAWAVLPVASVVPLQVAFAPPQESKASPGRRPLFLLHSALLI